MAPMVLTIRPLSVVAGFFSVAQEGSVADNARTTPRQRRAVPAITRADQSPEVADTLNARCLTAPFRPYVPRARPDRPRDAGHRGSASAQTRLALLLHYLLPRASWSWVSRWLES